MARRKLSREQYDRTPGINISSLKSARKSALQYKYDREHKREPSPAMEFGTAVHCAVFEPERFLSDYVAYRDGARRGQGWEQFKAEHESATILASDDYDKCVSIRQVVREHELVKPYLVRGKSEHSILWTDTATGLQCKGRVDWRSSSKPALLDLKTCRDISRFCVDAARLGYHLQGAYYHDGVLADTEDGEDLPFVFVAVESVPPHDVAVFELGADAMQVGRADYGRLLELVKYCTDNDTWPGAYMGPQDLVLPIWAGGSDDEITINGESIAV